MINSRRVTRRDNCVITLQNNRSRNPSVDSSANAARSIPETYQCTCASMPGDLRTPGSVMLRRRPGSVIAVATRIKTRSQGLLRRKEAFGSWAWISAASIPARCRRYAATSRPPLGPLRPIRVSTLPIGAAGLSRASIFTCGPRWSALPAALPHANQESVRPALGRTPARAGPR